MLSDRPSVAVLNFEVLFALVASSRPQTGNYGPAFWIRKRPSAGSQNIRSILARLHCSPWNKISTSTFTFRLSLLSLVTVRLLIGFLSWPTPTLLTLLTHSFQPSSPCYFKDLRASFWVTPPNNHFHFLTASRCRTQSSCHTANHTGLRPLCSHSLDITQTALAAQASPTTTGSRGGNHA